jgi:hypothetical protein
MNLDRVDSGHRLPDDCNVTIEIPMQHEADEGRQLLAAPLGTSSLSMAA